MELFLCRHGETKRNQENIIQGHSESEISERGRKQIEKLAERLGNEKIEQVYSSDMQRAVETAEKVAEQHDLEVQTLEGLREVDRSKFEGKEIDELIEIVENSDVEDYLWKPENGESLEDTKNRYTKTINSIREKHEDGKVAVISHGAAITSGILGLLGHSAKKCYNIEQVNCCINKLEWTERSGWRIKTVNSTCHLK